MNILEKRQKKLTNINNINIINSNNKEKPAIAEGSGTKSNFQPSKVEVNDKTIEKKNQLKINQQKMINITITRVKLKPIYISYKEHQVQIQKIIIISTNFNNNKMKSRS